MKNYFLAFLLCHLGILSFSQVGKVGINTTTPQAMLHVNDSSVVFTGPATLPTTPGSPPVSGVGTRMMWYADKAAFRVGSLDNTRSTFWDRDSIGDYSFSSGRSTKAKGFGSTAMGVATTASGFISTAMGNNTTASGNYSTATGVGTTASGPHATAMGFNTTASDFASTAMGGLTTASGDFSTAMGGVTTASGIYSTAMGRSTIAKGYASTVLGSFNDSILTTNQTSVTNTTPLFIIGNGDNSNTRSNAMVALKNGNIGIGTNTPAARLHVDDSSVVFTGPAVLPTTPGDPPISGAGTRMMWYADKGAFRVGQMRDIGSGSALWDKQNIGLTSFACGFSTKASGNSAFSAGQATEATGYGSTAFGQYTKATGANSFASGYFSEAIGSTSFASGNRSKAIGDNSSSFGYGGQANGDLSTAFGLFNLSNAYASFGIGQLNDPIIAETDIIGATTWRPTDPLFVVGNGTATSRSNAFIIAKNGETGINVANSMPAAALHIKGTSATFDAHLRLESAGANTDYCNLLYDGNTKFRNFGVGDEYQWRTAANVTIMRLQENGNLTINGVYSPSDMRLKKQITPLQNSLQKITSLGGYNYLWKDANRSNSLQAGVMAQQVEAIMPELVTTDEAGTKAVNYNGLIPYLIEAIKELKKENEALKTKMEQLMRQ
jgi:hypothetical protein